MLISVITTTYNRDKLLLRLFNALQKQTNYNFEWILIDDGSEEKYQAAISKIMESITIFKKYIFHQKNQGKHAALNLAFQHISGDVTVIVDSDDKPLPNMISEIISKWTTKRLNDPALAAIIFEKGSDERKALQVIKDNGVRANINNYRYFNGLSGDLAETFKSSILIKYHFPVQDNEKFLSEDYIWIDIGKKYDAIFYHQIIYLTEYLPLGLTNNIHKTMWNNPKGTLLNLEKRVGIQVPIKLKFKFNIMLNVFILHNKVNLFKELKKTKNPLLSLLVWPASCVVYFYYYFKYGE